MKLHSKKTYFFITIFLYALLFFNTFIIHTPLELKAESDNNMKSLLKEGDMSLAKRSLAGYEKALAKYKEALSKEPGNIEIMTKTANALNHIMRVKTNGNTLRIDGNTHDNEKNKKIWGKYGKEAVKLSEKAFKEKSDDCFTLNVYAESYMYYSSSFGILTAIFKGAAGQYKENSYGLINKCPKMDDAVGDIYMGCFNIVAPWPLSDLDDARDHFNNTLKLAPDSVRSHYSVGIIAIKDGKYDLAKKELTYVIENKCTKGPEHDFCGYIKDEAKKGIAIADKELKQ